MSRFRIVLLAFFAVVATSAVAASAASAASDAGQKLNKLPTGSKIIKATSKVSVLTVATTKVTCTGDTSESEITGLETIGKVKVTFTGCKAEETKVKCKGAIESPKGGLETIKLEPLKGEFGESAEAAGEASKEVVELLEPETGSTFVTLEESKEGTKKCTPTTAVTGQIAGAVTPVGKLSKAFTLTFGLEGKGKQAIKKVQRSKENPKTKEEEKVTPKLTAFTKEATETSTDEGEFSEELIVEPGV